MQKFLWLLAPLGFIVWWCFICFVISLASGWRKLAKRFRATARPDGQTFTMQRARFNSANYNGCLTIKLSPQGLYLKVWPLFGIGQPPLLIPWTELGAFKAEKYFWLTVYTTKISTGKFDKVALAFYDKNLVDAIQAHLPRR